MAKMLTKEQVQRLKKKLLEKREEFETLARKIEEESLVFLQSEFSGESPYGLHMADEASATFEREKDFSIEDSLRVAILRIDNALRKIEQGRYGICEVCGSPIGYRRLSLIPFVELCIKCKREDVI